MKRFFNEYSSTIIICIVISILLCIVGTIKGISNDAVDGNGLASLVGNDILGCINNFQNQFITSEKENIIQLNKEFNNKIAINSIEFPNGVDKIDITVNGKNLIPNSSKTMNPFPTRKNPEFGQYTDIAPIIDKYGPGIYTVGFDLKSLDISKSSQMRIYCQNSVYTKYQLMLPQMDWYNGVNFTCSENWTRYSFLNYCTRVRGRFQIRRASLEVIASKIENTIYMKI